MAGMDTVTLEPAAQGMRSPGWLARLSAALAALTVVIVTVSPGQQPSQDQQEHGDRGGGGQHLAQDAAFGGLRHLPGCLEWEPARSWIRCRSGAAGRYR
jgi:hypothetical protein